MSDQTNEPSCEPICEPTKQMNLDAELQTNLSQKKSLVAYSEPKQDAELPSKITDLTNTQSPGLCHDKSSEPESLADQQGINEEIDHQLLQPTVPKINGKYQHQSNLIPVNCGNLPRQKS
jgi:hypothetical protein